MWQHMFSMSGMRTAWRRGLDLSPRSVATAVATDLGHPYWIYIIPTHGMHQWLLLQLLAFMMMDAENVRNM